VNLRRFVLALTVVTAGGLLGFSHWRKVIVLCRAGNPMLSRLVSRSVNGRRISRSAH